MQTNHPLYAGVDFGTSGCRLILIDAEQSLIHSQQLRYSAPDKQSPTLWWNALTQLLLACPKDLKKRLHSIAIDGTSGTLLLTDQQGNPSSPALLYNDARAIEEAKKIAHIAPPENGAQGVTSSLSRLMWLLEHHPHHSHYHIAHQADWIMGKLSEQFGKSDENNCLKLGYDALKKQWPHWFDQLGIPQSLLPKVYPPATHIASISPPIATLFDLPLKLSIVAGTTDSIAAFIATGANKVGEAVTSLGSTLAIKLISDTPLFAPKYGIYSHRLENNWLIGGASNTGGAVLLKYFSPSQLTKMTPLLIPEKTTGLDYYPLTQQGERFPFADPKKKAQLSPRPTDDVLYFQAMLEGIATIEHQAYQRLLELGAPKLSRIYTVGGGSQNKAWTQIRKNKLNIDFCTPKQTEAAFGSALLALKGHEN